MIRRGGAGARVAFVEDQLGSLREGKRADLVVIDRDPFAIPATELATVRVVRTIVDGQDVPLPEHPCRSLTGASRVGVDPR